MIDAGATYLDEKALLRSNDATATRTSLKLNLRSLRLYHDYSYLLTLSNVREPS